MGSVKDLDVIRKPTKNTMGIGRFRFSDRYSVFDWGEMPDQIERKGQALCMMGAYCFERLMEREIETHYRGSVNEKGKAVCLDDLEQPSSKMEINLVNVIKPQAAAKGGKLEYDYKMFTPRLKNCLIPLEIIYRNGLPEGSSVFKRLEQGSVTIAELGLTHYPKPGEQLSKPIFDVSTKLEEKDRYITWQEAQEIAGLTDKEVTEVKTLLQNVDDTITRTASAAALDNEDGKIELAFNNERKLMTVDVVGTLDECRFTYGKIHVSKEIVRQFYRETKWYKEVEEAKGIAESKGIKDWKALCKSKPPKLDHRLKAIISEMYMAAANETTNRRFFEAPPLVEVIETYREYVGERN